MFRDRIDAGCQLASELDVYADAPTAIVLGIPRGGVVVAAQVAAQLRLPLDIVFAAKVGAPGNPEYAIGAVTADGRLLANPEVNVSPQTLEAAASPAREKLARQLRSLRGDRPPLDLFGRTTIVVDDGAYCPRRRPLPSPRRRRTHRPRSTRCSRLVGACAARRGRRVRRGRSPRDVLRGRPVLRKLPADRGRGGPSLPGAARSQGMTASAARRTYGHLGIDLPLGSLVFR